MSATDASTFRYFDLPFAAMAHRGGAGLPLNRGIENTIAAFERCVEMGYQYLETDVRLTRDGHVVVFHDETLERLCGVSRAVSDLSYEELTRYLVGGREPVPTLSQVLTSFPDQLFNIDIKDDRVGLALIEVLRRHSAFARVCVSSFDYERLRRFRHLGAGQIATGAAVPEVMMGSYLPGGVRLTPAQAFQIPLHRRVLGVNLPVLTRRLQRECAARDRRIHVWTIDDAETMTRLIRQGVDGIVTDRPDVLKDVCLAEGVWFGNVS